jgi:putative DNA primase/helicase
MDFKEIKRNTNIVDVVGEYVSLKNNGIHDVGLCPFHEDTKPTLTVTRSKNLFKCFACGESGDQIDFLIKMGMTQNEAMKKLSGGEGGLINPQKIKKEQPVEKIEWLVEYPFPELKSINHFNYGTPTKIWTYFDEVGNVLQHVCRFDLPDGSKQVLPLIWASSGNFNDWRFQAIKQNRPLYNLHLLKEFPFAKVVIVEGEKCAEHAQQQSGSSTIVFTCWIGGANGVKNTDFSPLMDKTVLLWPDHDVEQKYGKTHEKSGQIKPWFEQPGNHAMLEIAQILNQIEVTPKWIHVPDSFPNKWDVADKQWIGTELHEFIFENIIDVPVVDATEIKTNPTVLAVQEPDTTPENDGVYFKFLGYDKDESGKIAYYFFSYEAKTVVKLSPSNMSKSNLMMIAPINWWEGMFPGKSSVNIDAAQQYLISNSHTVGMFKDKMIRGRGAWKDGSDYIIHCGDHLLIKGKKNKLNGNKSRFVYEIGDSLNFGSTEQLPTAESGKIIDLISLLNWERGVNSYLMAGWCVIAPFSGILPWRPHVWLTGAAGSGKSWTMEHVAKKLIGDIGVVMQGKTTEAYVRGKLQNDALPVLFDESDVDSSTDKERVQSILALARSSSYENGGVVGKGTQSGGSKEYQIRSCFMFSSIGVQLNQQSDRSRFTMLTLKSFEGDKNKGFAKFHDDWSKLVTDDFVKKLHSRTLELLPIIIQNTKTFADAITQKVGSKRIGDQVGGMIAGAYSLKSKNLVTLEQALEWVGNKDWHEENAQEQTKDEFQLFGCIMSHLVAVESIYARVERTIGELITFASGSDEDVTVTAELAINKLRRIGIIVKNDEIIIANSSPEINKIIQNTAWSKNHNKILERIEGAKRVEPRVFIAGMNSRGVSLPINMIKK